MRGFQRNSCVSQNKRVILLVYNSRLNLLCLEPNRDIQNYLSPDLSFAIWADISRVLEGQSFIDQVPAEQDVGGEAEWRGSGKACQEA